METLIRVEYARHITMGPRIFLSILGDSYSKEESIKEFATKQIVEEVSKKLLECKRLNNWHFMNSRNEILKSIYEDFGLSKHGGYKEFMDAIFLIMPADASHIYSIKMYELE